ncbi:hypothetical protein SAMN02910441_00236 [Ruminococcus sp. YE282]|nr:hypothetical protein SAMN02910441_00236 [Ruminococcus bromii]
MINGDTMKKKRNIPVKILRGKEAREFFKKIPLDSEKPKEPKNFRFQLSDEQQKKYDRWRKRHKCSFRKNGIRYVGAAGGADTFHITGTGLGYIVSVECSCGSICDLTEGF